jgi:uncharacterized protein (TIGR03435 family)
MLAKASILFIIVGAWTNLISPYQDQRKREIPVTGSRNLLGRPTTPLPAKNLFPNFLANESEAGKVNYVAPLVSVVIKPSNSAFGSFIPQPGKLTGDGVAFLNLIAAAYQTPSHRVINQVPPFDGNYEVSVIGPTDRDDLLYPSFQRAVETTFGIRTRRESREMDVSVLRVRANSSKLRPSRADAAQQWFVDGKVHAQRLRVGSLAEVLETFLDRPVVDETELEGEYDWEFSYTRSDENMVTTAVREELGLEIVPGRRVIEVLIVEESE